MFIILNTTCLTKCRTQEQICWFQFVLHITGESDPFATLSRHHKFLINHYVSMGNTEGCFLRL